MQKNIKVIIPAYNEQDAIGKVIRDIPSSWVQEIVVVNNNSSDDTVKHAREAGATVLQEPRQGVWLCLFAWYSNTYVSSRRHRISSYLWMPTTLTIPKNYRRW